MYVHKITFTYIQLGTQKKLYGEIQIESNDDEISKEIIKHGFDKFCNKRGNVEKIIESTYLGYTIE